MTDDLTHRLRDEEHLQQRHGFAALLATAREAADRIEELEAKLVTKKTCPLGKDCDLTIAWMAGRESAKDECKAKIAGLEAKLAKAVGALASVIDACNEGRIIPRPGCGIGGMTIEANIKGSMYTGVPAWPIEEALITLAELKEETHE